MIQSPSDKPVQSFVRLSHEGDEAVPTDPALSGILLPDELIGRSFLLDEDEDGQRLRATIVKKIIEIDAETKK
jgi:hypothetical protein